jgi:putative effector of murein hydrolase
LIPPTILLALALWLNASIAAQTAAEITASLFRGTMFIFILDFMLLQSKKATPVPKPKAISKKCHKNLFTSQLTQ